VIGVVDDDDSVRLALSRLLRSAGFDARAYRCGEEFLNSLDQTRFGCAILDVHMPRVSGLDILEFLTSTAAGIPVVVITGRDSDQTRERVMAAGAVAYLLKPIDEQSLLSAVAAAVTRNGRHPG
jgi:FixJ family two-component response regulator